MVSKEAVGWIIGTSPIWSIWVNILIAKIVAREVAKEKSHAKSITVAMLFCCVIVLLTVYYLLA